MSSTAKIERRKASTRSYRIGLPLFLRVQKPLAASVLSGCALIAIFVNYAAPAVAFGPFFLVICAFGAWFVGNRFAVFLGMFIAAVQTLNGHAIALQDGPIIMAMKYLSALSVILMLGVARAALEIEWRFARIDPLTGSLNRKAFFEAVKNGAGESGFSVLIYADLDGLKCLNDRHGHEAGDEALCEFSDRVRGTIRKDDIFARIGGDEFVILLRVRDLPAAKLIAERLNNALNSVRSEREKEVKCSVGALVLPDGCRCIDTELNQADTLMYQAKKADIGLMMAIVLKDKVKVILSMGRVTKSSGEEDPVTRLAPRTFQTKTGGRLFENSDAA